jgi:predicted metal-dependent hydrolase
MTYSVDYGSTALTFSVIYAARKTLALHVYPDCLIEVEAPFETPLEMIKLKVLKRAKWILKQLRFYGQLNPVLPARLYISGENYRYLGRQYRLNVVKSIVSKVILKQGHLWVYSPIITAKAIKPLIVKWTLQKAELIFDERLKACLDITRKANISYGQQLVIKKMYKSWGRCSSSGQIMLNPELLAASKAQIDYVIIHELCHLQHLNHSSAFYDLLTLLLPEWQKRKEQLELNSERRLLV